MVTWYGKLFDSRRQRRAVDATPALHVGRPSARRTEEAAGDGGATLHVMRIDCASVRARPYGCSLYFEVAASAPNATVRRRPPESPGRMSLCLPSPCRRQAVQPETLHSPTVEGIDFAGFDAAVRRSSGVFRPGRLRGT